MSTLLRKVLLDRTRDYHSLTHALTCHCVSKTVKTESSNYLQNALRIIRDRTIISVAKLLILTPAIQSHFMSSLLSMEGEFYFHTQHETYTCLDQTLSTQTFVTYQNVINLMRTLPLSLQASDCDWTSYIHIKQVIDNINPCFHDN